MPYTPNFVFTDPVAASQLVGLAQIAQAEEAARNQAMLGSLQALSQQRVAQNNAAAERSRYLSQSDLQREQLRQQAAEGEKNRAARSSELDRTLSTNKDIAKMESEARVGATARNRQDSADAEAYNFVLSQVEGNNPPTDDEFKAMSLNLSPDRVSRLDGIRKQTISSLNQAADNADAFAKYWNARIGKLGPNNKTGETLESIVAEASKSQAGKFIIYDSGLGLFRPAVARPRAGAASLPPQNVETIQNLLKKVTPAPVPSIPGTRLPPWIGAMPSSLSPGTPPDASQIPGLPPWIGRIPTSDVQGIPPVPAIPTTPPPNALPWPYQ